MMVDINKAPMATKLNGKFEIDLLLMEIYLMNIIYSKVLTYKYNIQIIDFLLFPHEI